MLKIELIDEINPFDWEHFSCPLCGHKEFTSLTHAGVYCDQCNCRFNVRSTAGDPGCVVDCFTTKDQGGFTYAPMRRCDKCQIEKGLFDWQDLTCPANLNHGEMPRVARTWLPWTVPGGMERFCLVMKLGDYISGWSYGSRMDKLSRFSPTQAQWDAYCEKRYAA